MRRKSDIEYLLDRAESIRFRPCVTRQIKRLKIRATVTVTQAGYLAVHGTTKRDSQRLREASRRIERACRL